MKKQKKKPIYIKPSIKVEKVTSDLFSINNALSQDKCKELDKQN